MAILGSNRTTDGSRIVHDPRLLPKSDVVYTELFLSNNGSFYNVDNTSFHTIADRYGAIVQCASTANSYNTIVNISGGAGAMSCAYSPIVASTGPVVTFKFTVDGAVTEVQVSVVDSTYRAMIGGLSAQGVYSHDSFQTYVNTLASSGADQATFSSVASNISVMVPPLALSGFGGAFPLLGWTNSFKVEVKSTGAINGINNLYNRAGVLYLTL